MDKTKYDQEISKHLSKWAKMNRTKVTWAIVVALVVNIILYFFYVFGAGWNYANQNWATQALPTLIVIDLIGAVGSFVYIAWYKIPSEIYNAQEKTIAYKTTEIKELEARLSAPVPVDIQILPYEDYPRLKNNDLVYPMQIGITIRNSEFKDITDVDIVIVDAEQIYSGLGDNFGMEMRMNILLWRARESFDLDKSIVLKSQRDTHIGLIENDGKQAYFLLDKNKSRSCLQFNNPEEQSGQDIEYIKCEFLFDLYGKVDVDKPIKVKRYLAKVTGFHSIIYNDAGTKKSIRDETFSVSMGDIKNVEK